MTFLLLSENGLAAGRGGRRFQAGSPEYSIYASVQILQSAGISSGPKPERAAKSANEESRDFIYAYQRQCCYQGADDRQRDALHGRLKTMP